MLVHAGKRTRLTKKSRIFLHGSTETQKMTSFTWRTESTTQQDKQEHEHTRCRVQLFLTTVIKKKSKRTQTTNTSTNNHKNTVNSPTNVTFCSFLDFWNNHNLKHKGGSVWYRNQNLWHQIQFCSSGSYHTAENKASVMKKYYIGRNQRKFLFCVFLLHVPPLLRSLFSLFYRYFQWFKSWNNATC